MTLILFHEAENGDGGDGDDEDTIRYKCHNSVTLILPNDDDRDDGDDAGDDTKGIGDTSV